MAAAARDKVSIRQIRNSILVSFANKNAAGWKVRVMNINGTVIPCPVAAGPAGLSIPTKGIATGYYVLSVSNNAGGSFTRKIFIAK